MSESPEERMANNKVYSVDAFAAGVKSNHPEYAEVDNQELVGKMLEKYPQYRSQVDYSPVGGWKEETPKKKDSTVLESTGETSPTDSALPTEAPKRDAFKIIDENPYELGRLWNRAIAGSETGKMAARSFYGGSIDFEELAYYNKVLNDNAPKVDDWLAGDEENVVGSFLLDIVRTIPESIIGLVDASLSPEAAASAATGAAAGAAVGTVFAPITAAAGGAAGAAFAGSGMLTFGSTLLGKLSENGIDITNPKALEAAWNDEEFITPLAKESAVKAGIVGSFDALSAGLGGAVAKGVVKSGAKRITAEIAEYAVEGSLGASGEALGSLAAGDEINWRDVALEGLADPAAGISGRLFKSLSTSLEGKLDVDEQEMLNKFEEDPEGFQTKMNIFKVENAAVSKEIKTQVDELNGALKTAPKKQRATILKEIQKLEKKRTALQKESLDALDNMSEEDLTALGTLAEEIIDLSESTKSEEMTDSQKDAIGKIVKQKSQELKEIKQKFKKAETPVSEEPIANKEVEPQAVVETEASENLNEIDLGENETIIENREVIVKGEKLNLTIIEQTSEKDGIKTTKYQSNRSDRSSDKKSDSSVSPETVLNENEEINLEENGLEDTDEITKVFEVREDANGTKAADVEFTVTFPDGTKRSDRGTVKITKKAKEAAVKKSVKEKSVKGKKTEKAPTIKATKEAVPVPSKDANKKLAEVAEVRKAAPKAKYNGVKSRMKSNPRGYSTVIEKTDKRTGKVTRYEGDVFVDPKTKKVSHTVTQFVDGVKGKTTSYKDVNSFRDAINKKIKAGAKESEAFVREYNASPEGKSSGEASRTVEFVEEKTKAPVKSKVTVEKVTYKSDGKDVELSVKVNGSNRQRQLPYASVTNVADGKVRRFETKQQYDKWRNGSLARRNNIKVETISEKVQTKDAEKVFVQQEAPTEVKGIFKRPTPVNKGLGKAQKRKTTRKPFQAVVYAQVPQESRVYVVRDSQGKDRLVQKTIGKDGEYATYEVEEKLFAGGIKRYEIKEGAKGYENQSKFIKSLREESVAKPETEASQTPVEKELQEEESNSVKFEAIGGLKQLTKEDNKVIHFYSVKRGEKTSYYKSDPRVGDYGASQLTVYDSKSKWDAAIKRASKKSERVTEDRSSLSIAEVSTNTPLKISYNRNTERAPKMGKQFGQDVEAAGTYITQKEMGFTPEGFETGSVQLESPLVIDITNDTQIEYKRILSKQYGNKKGKTLSNALKKEGYDSIVTKYKDGTTGEIILLNDINTYQKERSSLAVRIRDRQEISNKRGVKPFVIREAIAKAKSILRSLAPDVIFITHKDTKTFNEAMTAYSQNGVNERSAEGGRYIYNAATGAREIHINLEFATASTPIHEAFHAFFDKAYSQDPIVAKDLAKVLYVALRRGSKADKAIAKKLESFIKRYDENVQSEEFLAELAGIMSEAEQTLSKPMIQKLSDAIKKFLLKLANKAGVDNRLVDYLRYDVLSNEAQQEAVQFMRSFINANSDSFLDPMNQPIPLAKNQDVKLEGVVKEMSELTEDYKKESKGFLLDYYQSGKEIKKGIATGRIKFGGNMSSLNGKAYMLHQPDNASVGIVKDENGNVIGENFGGMLFPERFKGAFWASTRSAASRMASQMNSMRVLGDGKIRMVLTAGTQEKLFSSTAASRNVGAMIDNYVSTVKMSEKQELSMYQSVLDLMFRKAGEINKIIAKQAELTDLSVKGKIENAKLSKLKEINEKLEKLSAAGVLTLTTDKKGHVLVSKRKFKTSEEAKTALYNAKAADVSIFPVRKDITDSTISSFVSSLTKEQKAILVSKFGYEKVSGLEIRDAFSEMLSEPAIKGVQTGMAYAILETNSEVEAVEVLGENAHPSYPYQIRLKDQKAEVKITILEKPENPHDADYYDFSKNFNFTNQLKSMEGMSDAQLSEYKKILKLQSTTIFPSMSGMSEILFRNINDNRINKINEDVVKLDTYKDVTALQKSRATSKQKFSDFYTKERSQLSSEEQQIFDAQESVEDNPNFFAKIRSRKGLFDLIQGLGALTKDTRLVFTETQKKVRVFLESMNSQLSFSALAVRKHASRLRKLANTPESLADVRAYITESDPKAKQDIAERIEKYPKGDAILATADSMRAMVDNLSQVFLDNPMFDKLPERAFKAVESYEFKKGKEVQTKYRVINTKTGDVIEADLTKAAAQKVADAPSIKDAIRANLGSYLHTSYRFFGSKDYKITEKAKRKAYKAEYETAKMNEFKKMIVNGATEEQALATLKEPATINRLIDDAKESINKYISEIEEMRKSSDFVYTGLSAGSIKIPKTALQQKKGIPEHIAELLGKEKDPVNSFIDTAMVMHKTIFKTQMVAKISEAFGGDFVKDSITKAESNSGEWVQVKDMYSPINGKYVQAEIFEMLQSKTLLQAENAVLNAYFKGLKVMRKSKVLWNLPTWRKNLTGGVFFIAANGIVNPAFLKDLKNRIDRTRKGEADPQIEALLKEMAELGLIGADVNAGLIDVNDAALNVLFDGDYDGANKHLAKTWNKAKNLDAKLAEKYAAIDDYTKLIIYRVEKESFAKKLYGKDYASLTEAQQKKVRDEAGEFVKQNTPTFSRLPKWYLNSFSKVPLGDFLGFKLESWRSITSNLRNAASDLKKGMDKESSLDDVQRKEYLSSGRKRMMGSIATLGARAVVPAILTSMFLGDDDEEIADDALAVTPDWMEGHTLVVKNISDDGEVSVYNYSMEDPYGEISDALMGDLSGFADFMNPNMFVKLAVHLTEGRDAYGRDLYDKSDPAVSKFASMLGYTTKSMIMPPSLVSTAKYQENQMLIRDYKYNLGQQFYFSAREYTKGTPYNELSGRSRTNRLNALDDVKVMYDSVMRVAMHKNNPTMMISANKVLNRFSKLERAYIQGGFEIEE